MPPPNIQDIIPYKLQLEHGERLGALDDPEPLHDGMHHNRIIHYAYGALIHRLRHLPGIFVDTNSFIYHDPTDKTRRVAPDIYAALGVDTKAIMDRNGYLIWEAGKPPDFVLEIASETTARHDSDAKRDLYAAIGVSEYWRYDHTGGDHYGFPLLGERLVNGKYAPYHVHTTPGRDIWSYSPTLDIRIYWGRRRFKIYNPDTGSIIPAPLDLAIERDRTEAMRAENEAIQAEIAATHRTRIRKQIALLRIEGIENQHDDPIAAYEIKQQARLAYYTNLRIEKPQHPHQ